MVVNWAKPTFWLIFGGLQLKQESRTEFKWFLYHSRYPHSGTHRHTDTRTHTQNATQKTIRDVSDAHDDGDGDGGDDADDDNNAGDNEDDGNRSDEEDRGKCRFGMRCSVGRLVGWLTGLVWFAGRLVGYSIMENCTLMVETIRHCHIGAVPFVNSIKKYGLKRQQQGLIIKTESGGMVAFN